MLRLYIPVAVVVLLIGSFTYWEAIYSDRWTSSSVTAAEFGKRFEFVPKAVGPWVGEEKEEAKEVLETAGAVSHVSRTYTNKETGAAVDLWLVVGHAREICRHTPDICYPSHGFSQMGSKIKQRVEVTGEPPATFFTQKFRDESMLGGQQVRRVFWAWNGNNSEKSQDSWEAPDYQKLHFGNNTALYKMYFTASMKDLDEPVEDNIALEFGKLMIPKVNRALFPERYTGDAAAEPAEDDAATEEAAADEGVDAESADSAAETGVEASTGEPAEDAAAESSPEPVAEAAN